MKNIAVLGSTGSIGTQTLEIVRNNPDLKVAAITVNNNIDLALEQIREFSPRLVCVFSREKRQQLQSVLEKQHPELLSRVRLVDGMDGLIEAAVCPEADIVVTAVVGMVGIRPTWEAIHAGKDIALANKETLVCAGHLIMKAAREQGVHIYPVDSEHSAIFQSLNGEPRKSLDKILLTASGGPFRGLTREMLEHVDVAAALNHPNWKMGKKVTIDSSTLANKGLEVMEARWLFDVPASKIQVVIQPQSIIHSMVQYDDGAIMAQLGTPDMKIPIQYALLYPERRPIPGKRIDFYELGQITFEKPDTDTFRALALAYEAIETGGSLPAVFNAANEKAVARFLRNEISYLDITRSIEEEMRKHSVIADPSLDEVIRIGEDIIYS